METFIVFGLFIAIIVAIQLVLMYCWILITDLFKSMASKKEDE